MRRIDLLNREVERVKSATYLEVEDASGGWSFIRIDGADGYPFHALPEEDRGAMLDAHVRWDDYERRGIDTLAVRAEAIDNPYPAGYDPVTAPSDVKDRPECDACTHAPEGGYQLATVGEEVAGLGG